MMKNMNQYTSIIVALVLLAPVGALAQVEVASEQDALAVSISRNGSRETRTTTGGNFTGTAHIEYLFRAPEPARAYGATVTFEPGARTAWHSHALGQTLIVTAGTGLVQSWGEPVQDMRQGDVVWIPPGVKHWHGAASGSTVTHISVSERLEDSPTEWMESVSDEQYAIQSEEQDDTSAAAGDRPSRAQQLMGDIAPKLADLTDDVLYGQVWAGAELSQRDRSLVTVSALIALNRPDQLRSHLAMARRNGVTQEELIGAITHLAFYSGWPNAVTAVSVAREVFNEE
jgi:4-carboxymuconolactone decarboxylase